MTISPKHAMLALTALAPLAMFAATLGMAATAHAETAFPSRTSSACSPV
jgi:hypothetical protein